MSSPITQHIDALCQEHNIEREFVIEAVKEAVRAAARKQFKGDEIQVEWDAETGLEISATRIVVETVTDEHTEISMDEAREMTGDDGLELGDALLLPMPMEELGRIAAQTAKQILFQKVRDAVRNNIYEEYIDRKGDLINGSVKRFERGNLIIDLGTNLEAILPKKEQTRGEIWNQSERIRVVISEVYKEAKGPQVEVSRVSPDLLKRLFEMEVPEIYDETVIIKSAVREPGERAKIAVTSTERDVDPVGACVGLKGSRVQNIIRELRGEKIDIIEWSDEPSVFAANALSPAKVNQVRITDIEKRQMEVIVNEDQLSLAIGKRGQNVRLATKLVGWNIDIRSEDELKKEIAKQMGELIASGGAVPLSAITTVSAQQAEVLAERGIEDIDRLSALSIDELSEFLDISLDEAQAIADDVKSVLSARDAAQTTPEDGAETTAADENASDGASEAAADSEESASTPPTTEVEAETASETEKSSAPDETLASDEKPMPDEPAVTGEDTDGGTTAGGAADSTLDEGATPENTASLTDAVLTGDAEGFQVETLTAPVVADDDLPATDETANDNQSDTTELTDALDADVNNQTGERKDDESTNLAE